VFVKLKIEIFAISAIFNIFYLTKKAKSGIIISERQQQSSGFAPSRALGRQRLVRLSLQGSWAEGIPCSPPSERATSFEVAL